MSDSVKRMAELLKSGATMLQETCPDCHVPLFRFRGEVSCPQCGRKVILVKSDEEIQEVTALPILVNVEETVLLKIKEINEELKEAKTAAKLQQVSALLSIWLDVLQKVRNVKYKASKAT